MKYYNAHEYITSRIERKKPLFAYDESKDHQEWEVKAKDKLMELLGLPFEKCDDEFLITEEKETEKYWQISFEFQSEEGYYIPCEFLVPKGQAGPLPTVICLQGHSSGKHISLGIEKFEGDKETIAYGDFAIQAVNEGYCAVVLEQRYMGETGQGENGTPSCFEQNRSMPTTLLGRTAIGERVWDISRLIDVMEIYLTKYVDKEHILCLGHSGGGTATFYAACLDKRISMAIPSCAVCSFKESIVPVHHCSCNYVSGMGRYFDMGDIGCLIAPRKLIQVNGVHDHLFWIGGAEKSHQIIQKAYRKLGCEDNCHMVKGEGKHQFFPNEVWPIIKDELKNKKEKWI